MARPWDLRSDTVTTPTAAMRRAMAEALVGDDVWGDDPTVLELQAEAAALFGKEAGLFVPSGTMSNLVALMAHCQARGCEAIVGDQSHICVYEQGSIAQVAGVMPRQVRNAPDGTLALEDLERAFRPVGLAGLDASHPLDDHFPITRVVCLENTHNKCGGRVLPLDYCDAVAALARARGAAVHLDGARLMNAVAALGCSPARAAACADSVSLCLSKALGAPAGSVLLGGKSFINRARRARKALGGTMRQAGVLAAPGLLALREMPPLLHQDHERARELGEGLNAIPGFTVDLESVQTNMVYASLGAPRADEVVAAMERRGVLIGAVDAAQVRAATHHQVPAEGISAALDAFRAVALELGLAGGGDTPPAA